MLHSAENVSFNPNLTSPMQVQDHALVIGFSLFGPGTDLVDILDYCHATALEVRGTHRTVMVPFSEVPRFLKTLDCVLDVENIHGVSDGSKIPLLKFLKLHGIQTNIAY